MPVDSSFLEQLKELHFITKRKVASAYAGGRASLMHGRGIEPVDYREYFPGDDFRLIDWRVYGRTEKLYVRRFEEERDLALHVLLDGSASMDFSFAGMNKFDYAGSLATGFAYLSTINNEKFATAIYSEKIRDVLQPNKGKHHLFKSINLINDTKLIGKTDLNVATGQYSKMMKSKSFTVIISDFMEPLESLKDGIYRMAKHSRELIMIQVLDPMELDLRWTDDIKFEDIELGDVEEVCLTPAFKDKYHKCVSEHIYTIQEICNDLNVQFLTMKTDKPLIEAFVELVGGRSHA